MKDSIQSYFKFSKKELNGILILFLILIVIFSVPGILRYVDEPDSYDLNQFKNEIASFKASASERKYSFNKVKSEIEDKEFKAEYFEFDPNIISEIEWRRLGLSAKQAKVIINYRSKGGKFFKKEDLKKIYSLRDIQYQKLEPYIKISSANFKYPERTTYPAYKRTVVKADKVFDLIELNTADSAALVSINGIGPAFASRIIKFRTRLGGFHTKTQLMEVYGLDSLKYSQIREKVQVDISQLKKININSVTFEELKTHAYLNYKQVNAIIQYRTQHGNYRSSGDLKQVVILNDEIIRKIEPYLSF